MTTNSPDRRQSRTLSQLKASLPPNLPYQMLRIARKPGEISPKVRDKLKSGRCPDLPACRLLGTQCPNECPDN